MSQALYRKYRSKKLSEIVGQEHITRTLDNALKTHKISHAYLFSGPRGVGKTSIARILAHEINNLPYEDESTHLDIIEIDAASNRGIEDIRDLREKVHIAPTSSKYKVYIIDEVHMLTKDAFNALLKTLEEPPAHVVFILATTELHKLPETVVSRTQRYTFKLIDDQTVAAHLKNIAKQEGLDIDDGALELIAKQGRGSFRDSISLLDQVGHSGKKISRADAEKLVGVAAGEHIESLLDAALGGSAADILNSLDQLADDGINPAQAAKQLSALLRRRILDNGADQTNTALLNGLLEVSASPDPAGKLEVVLLSANLAGLKSDSKPVKQTEAAAVTADTAPGAETAETPAQTVAAAKTPERARTVDNPEPHTPHQIGGEIAAWWGEVLNQLKGVNNTLYGVMRMATPSLDGDTIHLGFNFGLHAKKVAEADTNAKIHAAITKVTGKSFQINAVVDKTQARKTQGPELKKAADIPTDGLDSVKNIFGGGEVLES